jgi:hypothetical protein
MGLEYPDRLDPKPGRVFSLALDKFRILLTAAAEILEIFQTPSRCLNASRRALAVHNLLRIRIEFVWQRSKPHRLPFSESHA